MTTAVNPHSVRLLQKAAAEVAKMQEDMGEGMCVMGPTAVLAECVQREPVGWRSRGTATERGRGSCGCTADVCCRVVRRGPVE